MERSLRVEEAKDKIIAKGMSCFEDLRINTDAISGAILTFNKDGSINLICGVMEIGSG